MLSSSPGTQPQRRFSFTRMFDNMFPPLLHATEPASLSTRELDALFEFQTALKEPKRLGPGTLYIMNICPDERIAQKVASKLEAMGILRNGSQTISPKADPTPLSTTSSTNTVDTTKITSDFTNQLSMLPVWRQKRLICLLFAWEEELMRWRLLEEEELEITVVMDEEQRAGNHAGEQTQVGHLEKRLMEIQGLAGLKPSLRSQRRSTEILPGYQTRRSS